MEPLFISASVQLSIRFGQRRRGQCQRWVYPASEQHGGKSKSPPPWLGSLSLKLPRCSSSSKVSLWSPFCTLLTVLLNLHIGLVSSSLCAEHQVARFSLLFVPYS
ncbi:hypothetical protein BCR44DRAFT_261078 [Catenaria anguillulae PL171]|uniref:Uncharacterized protein n=1 Tax=Catenaria anguillulae PL171 TaxID=765915 RepID=A0A1Y2HCA2_9FUNG|nr:hypothetical protein BCR44DRAFT_261078 [Catenaria anguillulae PL171]